MLEVKGTLEASGKTLMADGTQPTAKPVESASKEQGWIRRKFNAKKELRSDILRLKQTRMSVLRFLSLPRVSCYDAP